MIYDPSTYESAMSLLTLAIASIERHPPRCADDLARLRLAVSGLDTITSRVGRGIENARETTT